MKRLLVALAVALVAALAIGAVAYAGQPETGNGAPSGAHYNLNIIGVQQDKNVDPKWDTGNRIFVDLGSNGEAARTKINLYMGEFAVLDANGTDDEAAFRLPNPDPENSGTSWYSVYARALGKPGGKADVTTCAEWLNPETNELETVCSVAVLEVERIVGKGTNNKFMNATAYLLYIYVDLDGDGKAERYNIFNDALQDYFWQYDNQGLKLLQLRFYPGVPTTVPDFWP